MDRRFRTAVLLAALSPAFAAAEPPVAPNPRVGTMKPSPRKIVAPVIVAAPESAAVPDGSYLRSCRHMEINGGVLTAECETGRNGGWHVSSLPVARCGGADIFNRWGTLMCATPVRANWGDYVLPPGSYLASCAGRVVGTTLQAACGTGASEGGNIPFIGSGREGVSGASLDLSRCPDGSEIANMRGELVCIAK